MKDDIVKEFKQSLIIKEDEEEIRLLKLQKEFDKGNIREEEIAKEDIEKLHELYNKQIEMLEKSTEEYKQKIIQIRKNNC